MGENMTEFIPYIKDGKHYRRRYLNIRTGETISRRQYIIRTEGRSPEQKAVERYEQGLTKKEGVTVRKYRKYLEKIREQINLESTEIPIKQMRYGDKTYDRYQLAGKYLFRHEKTFKYATSVGYSYAVNRIKYGIEFDACRYQAIDNAAMALGGDYNWNYIEPVSEHWIHWQ